MNHKKEFEKQIGDGLVSGSVSLEKIKIVESILDVDFPDEYIHVLNKYGSILLNGRELYGIVNDKNDPPLFQPVVTETEMRREKNDFFAEKKQYIPIATNGCAKIFFLDTSFSPNVCIKSYEYGIEKTEYHDVYEFLLNYEI